MNTNIKLIDRLHGYSNDAYKALRQSGTFTTLVLTAGISLTLVNNCIDAITTVYNRKQRRKYITQLISLMFTGVNDVTRLSYDTSTKVETTHDNAMLHNLLYVLTACNDACQTLAFKELRILTIDNSSWKTAYTIGDSTHYTSCLRSGARNPEAYHYNEESWTNLLHAKGLRCKRGCNHAEYITEEVDAFEEGQLLYLAVGNAYHESPDATGFSTRVRVHVVRRDYTDTDASFRDEDTYLLVDRCYGQEEYLSELLRLLLTRFPGRVYLMNHYNCVEYNHLITDKVEVDFGTLACGVYSDYVMLGRKLLTVGDIQYGDKLTTHKGKVYSVIRHARDYRTLMHSRCKRATQLSTVTDDTNSIAKSVSYNQYVNSRNPYSSSHRPAEACSIWKYTIRAISNHFNVYVRVHEKYASMYYEHGWKDTKLTVGYNQVTWYFRGYSYNLQVVSEPFNTAFNDSLEYRCAILSRVRIDPNKYQSSYVYNWVKGTWDKSHTGVVYDNHYHMPRRCLPFVFKHMPKNPTARKTETQRVSL